MDEPKKDVLTNEIRNISNPDQMIDCMRLLSDLYVSVYILHHFFQFCSSWSSFWGSLYWMELQCDYDSDVAETALGDRLDCEVQEYPVVSS